MTLQERMAQAQQQDEWLYNAYLIASEQMFKCDDWLEKHPDDKRNPQVTARRTECYIKAAILGDICVQFQAIPYASITVQLLEGDYIASRNTLVIKQELNGPDDEALLPQEARYYFARAKGLVL